jgi:SAM-dependent methyltransferase
MNFDPIRYWTERVGPDATLADTGVKDFSLGYNQKLYKLKTFAFKRLLAPHAAQLFGQPALNVGCGSGYFEDWLERIYGMRTFGVDISPRLVAALQRKFRARRYERWNFAEGANPHFDREYFQLITFIDISYHIIDDALWSLTLLHAMDHLRPGGLLLLTDIAAGKPSCSGPHVRFRPLEAYEEVLTPCHLERIGSVDMYYLFNRFHGPWINPGPLQTWIMFLVDAVATRCVTSNNMKAVLWRKQRPEK